MNIGIIVYSFSRHTLKVAKILNEKLASAGHKTELVLLEPIQPLKLSSLTAELTSIPKIDTYNVVILAAPVHGGRMAAPMAGYLEKIPTFKGKKVLCLATHFFPTKMGGDQTLHSMNTLCASKDARIIGSGSVAWFSMKRKRSINDLVNQFAALI